MQVYQVIDWQGRQFRQYHMLRLLKRDRIGALWLAEEGQGQRYIVVRLLPGVAADAHEYIHQFEQIALASSGLEHPHILSVQDSGVEAGNRDEVIPFLVYPYLEQATTLHAHLQRTSEILPAAETFRHLFQAARAIDYAHSQQVVHGGIQPACLLLDGTRLLLTDFCLASLLDSDITISRTYSVDLPYLAPEQAQGEKQEASDCYSLAMVAYQLFAGRLPFEGKDNPYELLLQQLTLLPPAPGRFNPTMNLSMENVLLKGLSRQPQQRYPSCLELVSVLDRAWKGLPLDPLDDPDATLLAAWKLPVQEPLSRSVSISASPPAPVPSLPAIPSSIAVEKKAMAPMKLTPDVLAGTSEQAVSPQIEIKKGKLNRRTVLIGGTSAIVLAAGGATLLTLWLRTASFKRPPGPLQFTPGKPLVHLISHRDIVSNVAWDSSGRYIASAGEDSLVMLWDVGDLLLQKSARIQIMSQATRRWQFTESIFFESLCWTSSGRKLIVSGLTEGSIQLLDPFARSDVRQMYSNAIDASGSSLYLNAIPDPRSDLLAAFVFSREQMEVLLWREGQPTKATARLTWTSPDADPKKPLMLLTTGWSCDGAMIAGLTSGLDLVIWDVNTHGVKKTFKLPMRKQKIKNVNVASPPVLAWSPIDTNVLVVTIVETIVLVDIRKEKPLDVLSTDNQDAYTPPINANTTGWVPHVLSASWSPNGRYIVAGYSQAFTTMAVWDVQKKAVKRDQEGGHLQDYLFPPPGTLNAHTASITDISWSPDGRYLATASVDKTILIWQVDASEA
jgi:eukaryotic-like serine/threonine-protein kinase